MIRLLSELSRVFLFVAGAGFIFAGYEAVAQTSNGNASTAKTPSRRTSINFEDQLIEGQAQKPELFYLLQQRNNNFKRLIRLRENFLPEMRKASEDVGRSSGRGSAKGSAD